MHTSERVLYQAFIDKRNSLIDKLDRGDLNKKEFLQENYHLLQRSSLKPFSCVNSYEKGIFNYQYYNVLAKYNHNKANECRNTKNYAKLMNLKDNYYVQKDRALIGILSSIDYQDVEAYYIQIQSMRLKNKLFEINLLSYEKSIFHSMNLEILNILKTKGVFYDTLRLSLIDTYVNENY